MSYGENPHTIHVHAGRHCHCSSWDCRINGCAIEREERGLPVPHGRWTLSAVTIETPPHAGYGIAATAGSRSPCMTTTSLPGTTQPTPAEMKAIADQIVQQLVAHLGEDASPTAAKAIRLTRAEWSAIVAVLRHRERET